MRKTIKRIIAALMLIFMVSVIASPATVQAATKTTAAQQKKCAKKALKYYKKIFKSNEEFSAKIVSKKVGSRYMFTVTVTSRLYDIDVYIRESKQFPDVYKKLLKTYCKISKAQYKNAKIDGLKKPIFRIRLKSKDGYVFVSSTNGEIDD